LVIGFAHFWFLDRRTHRFTFLLLPLLPPMPRRAVDDMIASTARLD
jgi:hypothetical protein